MSGKLFLSFCLGVTPTLCGGVESLNLTAKTQEEIITVENVTVSSNSSSSNSSSNKTTQACYWIISTEEGSANNDSLINLQASVQKNVKSYVFSGSSRYNASEAVVQGNSSLTTSEKYQVSALKSLILVLVPDKNQKSTHFEFKYSASGLSLNWW